MVHFSSPGGDVGAGMLIGTVIREFGLATLVAEDAECASSCTVAFLGGVDRRILGFFVIHAMATHGELPHEATDTAQYLAAHWVNYERAMVGSTFLTEAAMMTPHTEPKWVPDELLRDWGIITHAMRNDQKFQTEGSVLANCTDTAWLAENGGAGRSFARI